MIESAIDLYNSEACKLEWDLHEVSPILTWQVLAFEEQYRPGEVLLDVLSRFKIEATAVVNKERLAVSYEITRLAVRMFAENGLSAALHIAQRMAYSFAEEVFNWKETG